VSDERYIVIPEWEQFQNADVLKKSRDGRLPWIKVPTRLLDDDAFMELTPHQRAVLYGLWLAYASSGCQLRVNTTSLSRRLGLRVSTRQLDALNRAGFIGFSSRAPLEGLASASRLEVERDVEKERPPTSVPRDVTSSSDAESHDSGNGNGRELELRRGDIPELFNSVDEVLYGGAR
jgi:hypothetical protein